jgi:hypothetical protein
MGSSAFEGKQLPKIIAQQIDAAIQHKMLIIVGEAKGACRSFQDYLHAQGYRDVIVGHARSLRYNAGDWPDIKYGDNLAERERNMIKACDTAIIIWVNKSGQIAANLELLKWLRKPTFVYETSSYTAEEAVGLIDPDRIYQPFLYRKFRQKYGKPPISER